MKIKKLLNPELLTIEQNNIDNKLKEIYDDPMYDGIIDVYKYCEAPIKILWILKEVNDIGAYNQRDAFQDNVTLDNRKGWYATLDPVIYISYAILHNFMTWKDLSYIIEKPEMTDILKYIAYININKEVGRSVSSESLLKKQYEKYKDVILSQINLANPDIIICGNTIHHLLVNFGINKDQIKAVDGFDLGYFNQIERLFICSYHPNYYMRIEENQRGEYFDAIIQTVKEWCDNKIK
jgi:hypothetical protein